MKEQLLKALQNISEEQLDTYSDQEIVELHNSIVRFQEKLREKIDTKNEFKLASKDFHIIPSTQMDSLIGSIINVAQGSLTERIPVNEINDDNLNSLSVSINMLFEEIEWKTQILSDKNLELAQQHHFVRSITDAISDILYILDITTGHINYTNKEMVAMIGYKPEEIIGQESAFLTSLIHPDDIVKIKDDLNKYKTLKQGEVIENEFRLKHKNGSWIWANRKTSSFSFDEEGNIKEVIGTLANITNRKESEISIIENEAKFRTLTQASSDAIIISNSSEEIITWSNGAENIFGYSVDEILGKQIKLIVPEKYLEKHTLAFTRRKKEKDPSNSVIGKTREIEGKRKNGEIFPIEINLSAWSVNDVQYFSAVIRDITERKSMEKIALDREKKLQKAQQMAKLAYWSWDLIKDEIEWSDEAYAIFGEPLGSKINFDVLINRIHPEDREKVKETFQATVKNKTLYEVVHRVVLDDKTIKHILEKGELSFTDNKPVKIIGTMQDITQRVLLDKSVKESKERLKSAQKMAKLGYWNWYFDSNIIEWSDEAYNIFGTQPETVIKYANFLKKVHPADREQVDNAVKSAVKNKGIYEVEHRIILPNKEIKYVIETGELAYENDVPVKMTGTVQDITQRVELSLLVKESEERLKEAQKIANLGHWDWKINEGSLYWSDEIFNIFGIDKNEFGASYEAFTEFVHPEDRDKVNEGVDLALKKLKDYKVDHRIVLKDGTLKHVEEVGFVHFENEKPIRMIGTVLDITTRKKAEIELTRSLEEKDVLLKEIHHRVKNNLQIVDGLLSLQLRKTKDTGARLVLQDSKSRIKTIALVHEQLYQQDNLGQINFSMYMQTLVKNIRNTAVNSFKQIHIVFDMDPINIQVDKAIPLGLIANELIINAYKHAFDKIDKGEINISFKSDNDQYILTIKDSGLGFPTNFKERQKDSLGYKIINSLVGQLDAEIESTSDNGASTSITFEKN